MDEVIEELAAELLTLKEELAATDERRKKIQHALVVEMRDRDLKSATCEVGKITLVEPEKQIIDEHGLKRRLGAAKWKKVSREVVDKAKLEAAVTMGTVDIADVAECTHYERISSYVTIKRGRG